MLTCRCTAKAVPHKTYPHVQNDLQYKDKLVEDHNFCLKIARTSSQIATSFIIASAKILEMYKNNPWILAYKNHLGF